MRLGELELPRTAALAPMAGVADRAFREICREQGAAFTVGEMASAKGLCYRSKKTAELLGVTEAERPMAVQLFGDDPEAMAKAAVMAAEYAPDWIDINMGCPAPKVAGNGSGAALLRNLPLAREIIRAVVGAVKLPVTVKLRKGWDETHSAAVEAAGIAEQEGAAAVTVHGRTRSQMYAPPVDTGIIREVKRAVSIPVIANGDVRDAASALQMYGETDCDLVMIGRGALGSPWVFRQIQCYMDGGGLLPEPTTLERLNLLLEQVRRACLYKGEYAAMREARSHAAWYLKGMRGAASLRREAGQLRTYDDLRELVEIVERRE